MKLPASIQAAADRVFGWAPVVTGRAVLDRYGAAGGGLLAGGLTYAALFALLPALLLVTSIVGLLVDDPARRAAVVAGIAESLPPLRQFLDASLDAITRGAAGAGILALLALAWGASRFYGSLDDAIARIFANAPKRSFISRTIRGFVSVVLLVAVLVVTLALTGLVSYLAAQTSDRLGPIATDVWRLATPALVALVFIIATLVLYRVVPARSVTWSAALVPAVMVGLALMLVTQLFSFIAPRLIGVAALFGTFAALFAAMLWMALCFQLLLIGASWVRERLGDPLPEFLER